MRRYGLIGKNLSHTFSPGYFKKKFETENILDASYSIFDLENIEDIKMLFEDGIDGFNVTIPYKETIIPFLDSIDEAAAEIGAVNCVKKTKNGFKGHNTDAYGFDWALEANTKMKEYITAQDHQRLINYSANGRAFNLAIPSPEHYLPLLYILALQEKKEEATFFNDKPVAGSLTMTSVCINAMG